MNQKVKHYFTTHPDSNECFETSDGFLFAEDHRATAHGNTLTDKAVTTHDREDFEDAVEDEDDEEVEDSLLKLRDEVNARLSSASTTPEEETETPAVEETTSTASEEVVVETPVEETTSTANEEVVVETPVEETKIEEVAKPSKNSTKNSRK